ncbi:unnamed protein product, partial [Colias eurytheme]
MTIDKQKQGMEIRPEKEEEVRQIRELTLEHGEHKDATLYRFEKGYYVHFVPGPSLVGRKVYVYTNYVVTENPEEAGERAEFVRNQYYPLEWRRDGELGAGEPLGAGALLTDTDVYCELRVARAGPFHYYFVYDNPESRVGPQGSGWFAVSPSLRAGGAALPLDGVACQTVLAKCLGPLPRWERVLRVAHEAGYNMLHFTPVQVSPSLRAGGAALPLDGVACQTVLAKCLGPLPRWERVLRVAHEAGYNMLHFTPVQVSPSLRAGGAALPLDGVACQTVLAKCLGPLPRWERVLRVAHEAGYNMLHFTPVQVSPSLRAGGAALPLDGVACQTVLAKCLGPLPRWERVLRVAHEAGYNMLHFTPVQVSPSLRAGGAALPLDGVACQTVLAKCLGPLPRWERVLRVAHEAGYNMLHFTPVQVSPSLRAGGAALPLDGVACQTVLAKCLGPLPRWERVLRVAHEAGYNMLHFTPVQVSPSLRAGGAALPLDGVACQTVLAKCLGPLPRWERVLRVAHEAGYNMLHFTPVQVSPSLRAGGAALPLDGVACQTVLAKCLGPLPRWERVLRVAHEAGYNMLHFTPVQVSPSLRAGGAALPLDGVACQTVLAKCLGPLPRWERVLRVAHEAGYNMLHFTPVQELGASDSSYSIMDQLKLNPRFNDPETGREATYEDVEKLISKMENDWKMLSIGDVVLNHTANETAWLAEHPEAAYNVRDCPHLRPAALLDAALARFSARLAAGLLPGLPRAVGGPQDVDALRQALREHVLPELRLEDVVTCDVDRLVQRYEELARNRVPSEAGPPAGALRLAADPQRRRRAATVDMDLALALYNTHGAEREADAEQRVARGAARLRAELQRLNALAAGELRDALLHALDNVVAGIRAEREADAEQRVARGAARLRAELQRLNALAAGELRDALLHALDNVVAGIRYERLQSDGPRTRELSAAHPLAPRYFTAPRADPAAPLAELEAAIYGDDGRYVMAHNGWVMGADPLQDFAAREHDGRVYLRRELIAWGDSVKLRYGARPEDSAFLWAHMRRYVERSAALFHGLRLDNCHSTPLHVAEYLLDCARAVRPDLYVVAELFTNSDHVDNIFVNRLGITSLIREAQSAWDAHEQGRQLHRF